MNKINVMQGRLSYPLHIEKIQKFPLYTWKEEFESATSIGLDGIEWICDIDLTNPLLNLYTINKIRELSIIHNININTFCMDFLEDINDIFNENYKRMLTSYIEAAESLSVYSKIFYVPKIVIPLFKKLTPEFVDKFSSVINRLMPLGINYKKVFEIDDFDGYRKRWRGYRICYDIGNRQLSAENICDELMEFEDTITHIHIKEKNKEGVSVSLGQGIIGFGGWEKIFETLKKIKYKHDFTLQLARCEHGNEIDTIGKQYIYIKGLLNA